MPLIFSGAWHTGENILSAMWAASVFCLVASALYIINDSVDAPNDRLHPRKSQRPIAANKITIKYALMIAGALFFLASIATYLLGNTLLTLVILGYIANTMLYTFFLKKKVILDAFSIATGFVLRALGGVFIIDIVPSSWLFLLVFFGALLLTFLKRYQELVHNHSARKTLSEYSRETLTPIIMLLGTTVLLSYALYTFNSVQSQALIITVPIVSYGMLRYLWIIFGDIMSSESVDHILWNDLSMRYTLLIYILTVGAILVLTR